MIHVVAQSKLLLALVGLGGHVAPHGSPRPEAGEEEPFRRFFTNSLKSHILDSNGEKLILVGGVFKHPQTKKWDDMTVLRAMSEEPVNEILRK